MYEVSAEEALCFSEKCVRGTENLVDASVRMVVVFPRRCETVLVCIRVDITAALVRGRTASMNAPIEVGPVVVRIGDEVLEAWPVVGHSRSVVTAKRASANRAVAPWQRR